MRSIPAGGLEGRCHIAQFLSMKVQALGGNGLVVAWAGLPQRTTGKPVRRDAPLTVAARNLRVSLGMEIFVAEPSPRHQASRSILAPRKAKADFDQPSYRWILAALRIRDKVFRRDP